MLLRESFINIEFGEWFTMLDYIEQIDHRDVQKAFLVSGIPNDAAFAAFDLIGTHSDTFDRFLEDRLSPNVMNDGAAVSKAVYEIMGSLEATFALCALDRVSTDTLQYLPHFIAADLSAPRAGIFSQCPSDQAYGLQKFAKLMDGFGSYGKGLPKLPTVHRRMDTIPHNHRGMFGFSSYGWRLGGAYVEYDTEAVRVGDAAKLSVKVSFKLVRRGDMVSLRLAEDKVAGRMLQSSVMPVVQEPSQSLAEAETRATPTIVQEQPIVVVPIHTSDGPSLTAELQTVALPPYVPAQA